MTQDPIIECVPGLGPINETESRSVYRAQRMSRNKVLSTKIVNKVCLPRTLTAPSIDLVSVRDPEVGPEEELLTAMEADDTPRETKLRWSPTKS